MMDQEQRAAMRAKAERATPGPWRADEYDCGDVPHWNGVSAVLASEEMDCAIVHWAGFAQEYWRSARGDKEIAANAAYIAAANPAAILSLLDALAAADDRMRATVAYLASMTAERDAARAEAQALRVAVREWVAADRDLRDHPPNDTTKRWERKLERAEAARAALATAQEATHAAE